MGLSRSDQPTPPSTRTPGGTTACSPRARLRPAGRLGTLGAGLLLALASCSEDEIVEARLGDSLLDLIRQEHLEAYPRTNLPPEVLALVGQSARMRSPEFALSDWVFAGAVPQEYAAALGPQSPVRLWRVQRRLPIDPGAPAPLVFHDGRALASWDPATEPFPGLTTWYEHETRSLFALSEDKPTGICLEREVEVEPQLATCEMLLGDAETFRSARGERLPAVEDLVQRIELNKASRRSLLLPSGGSLAIPFESFPADGLRLATGIIDSAFGVEEDSGSALLVRETGLSDGAEFVVEVIEGGVVHEAWRKHIDRSVIHWGYLESGVDLRPWRGKSITLRLRTEAGPAGDAVFDYALWSDLRLASDDAPAPARPHVVLIDIDTLRADRMSSYGHELPTTPRIDAWFARDGTRYEDALAPATWTLPSTASLLTGLAPHQHRVLGHDRALPAEVTTLATMLHGAGYQTCAVVEGVFLGRGFGLDAGFEEHRVAPGGDEERVAEAWSRMLRRIRPNRTGRPVFLFLQTYLVHAPYRFDPRFEDPLQPYQGKLSGKDVDYPDVIDPYLRGELELSAEDKAYVSRLYDAGIARMDQAVGGFLEDLDAALGDQEALVILTSDHGEEFFEHGALGHGQSVYEELLRVPLLMRFPGTLERAEAGPSVPTSLLDLAPTVLEVAGIQLPDGLPGSSLLSALPERRVRVSQASGLDMISFDGEKLVQGQKVTPRWKYGPTELYDLVQDPGERDNLVDERNERATQLERALRGYLSAYPVVAPDAVQSEISAEDADALRALGYLGDG